MFMNTAATTNRGVKSRLSEPRVVDAIKEALRNHSEHEKIQEYGAATFRNMQFEEHRARCDGCQIAPIFGTRWACQDCDDFDLCQDCYQTFKNGRSRVHPSNHDFLNKSLDQK